MTITRRLLIPTLAFLAIILVGLLALQTGIDLYQASNEQEESMATLYNIFNNRLQSLENFSVALATEAASNPEIQAAFAAHDREKLTKLTLPSFLILQEKFGIVQYQYHLPPATSFLRLHQLDRFDDDLSSFRRTVLNANESQQPVAGLEIGRAGLGIRGVVPVEYETQHVGTVEFGLSLDQNLLNQLKTGIGSDWQILIRQDLAEVATFDQTVANPGPTDNLLLLYSTLDTPLFAPADAYNQALNNNPAFTARVSQEGQNYSYYTAPIRDFSGTIIGTVNIITNRAEFIEGQTQKGITFAVTTLIALAIVGIGLGTIITRSLRPIGELTTAAEEIAAGDINRSVPVTSQDELGILAKTFNTMTARLHELIDGLEERVAARTRDLELAAEVGRDLSEVQEVDTLLVNAVNRIHERFGLYYAQIYLIDEDNQRLVLRAGTGEAGRALLQQKHALRLDGVSINSQAVSSHEAIIVPDTEANDLFHPNPLLPDTRSEMAVPLVSGQQVIGVLDMQSNKPHELTEENLPAFQALAGQLVTAIENATLFTQRQRSEEALRRNEAQLREAQSIARLGYWEFDLETQLYTFTDQIFEILHTTAAAEGGYQMSAETYSRKFVHPEDIPLLEAGLRKAFNSTDPDFQLRIGYRFLCVDGEIGYAQVTMKGDRDENGRITRIFGTGQDITERRAAEEALRENEARLAEANRISKLYPWEFEVATQMFTFTEEYLKFLGTSVAENGGYLMSAQDYATKFVPPEESPVVAENVGLAIATDDPNYRKELESTIIKPDGTIVPIRVRFRVEKDDAGNTVRILGANQDITEPKAAEEALRENEARLAEANRISKLYPWEFEVATQMFTFTEEYLEFLGTSVAENGGYEMSAQDYATKFVPPEESPIVAENVGLAIATDDPNYRKELESTIIRPDGTIIPIRVRFRIEKDDAGNTVRILGANQDITETVQAEEELRLLSYVTEQSLDGALIINLDLTVRFINPAWAEMHGYEVAEIPDLIGQHVAIFHTIEQIENEVDPAGMSVMRTGKPFRGEIGHMRKDGSIFPTMMSINVLRDANGKPIGQFAACQDISERKVAEEALRENEARLEEANRISKLYPWEFEIATQMFTFTEAYLEFLGTSVAENGGYLMSAQEYATVYVPPEEAPVVGENVQLAIETTDPNYSNEIESVVLTKDGRLIPIRVRMRIEKDDAGNTVKIIGANQDITETKAITDALQKQAQELQTVAEVSTKVAGALDEQTLLKEVANLTKERFGLYHAHIYLLDSTGKTLALVAGAGEVGQQMVSSGHSIRLGQRQSLVARAARTRQGVIVNDVQADPGFLPNPLLPDTRAEMAVPLIAGDEVLGVLDIQADEVNRFTEQDVQIQTTMATQVAVSLQNARFFAQSQEAMENLSQLTRRLTREGWEAYQAEKDVDQLQYLYDAQQANKVVSVDNLEPFTNGDHLVHQLTVYGEPIGQIIVAPDEEEEAEDETYEIIAAVAEQLGARLENLRLTEQTELALSQTEQQAKRLASLNDMAAAINEAQEIEDIFQIATEQTLEVVGGNRVSGTLLNEAHNAVTVMATSGVGDSAPVGTILPLKEETGLATAVNEYRLVTHQESSPQETVWRSTIIAPLIASNRVLGTLNIGSKEANAFNQNDENLLRQVAALLASTIENRRLFDETEDRAEQLAAINRVSQALSQYLDRTQLLEATYEQIKQVVDLDTFFIGFHNAQSNTMDHPIIYEADVRTEQYNIPLAKSSYSKQAMESGKPLLVHLTREEAAELQQDSSRIIGSTDAPAFPVSLIFVPLIAGQRTIGIMASQSYQYNAYTQSDVTLLEGIGRYLAVTLENVRFFQETQERARREQLLREITARVRGSADVDTVMRTAVQEIGRTLGRKAFIQLETS